MFAFRRGATNAHHPQELVDILEKENKKNKKQYRYCGIAS
jgi:hypothetical protein